MNNMSPCAPDGTLVGERLQDMTSPVGRKTLSKAKAVTVAACFPVASTNGGAKGHHNNHKFLQYCLTSLFHSAFAAGLSCHKLFSLAVFPATSTACWCTCVAQFAFGLPRFLWPSVPLGSILSGPDFRTACLKTSSSGFEARRPNQSSCLSKSESVAALAHARLRTS